MQAVAIFPVTFARVEDLGGDYVPMNMTEFRWPRPFAEALVAVSVVATRKFLKISC